MYIEKSFRNEYKHIKGIVNASVLQHVPFTYDLFSLTNHQKYIFTSAIVRELGVRERECECVQ